MLDLVGQLSPFCIDAVHVPNHIFGGTFFMAFLMILSGVVAFILIFDLGPGLVGVALTYFDRTHCLGVRLVAYSSFLSPLLPQLCHLPCPCSLCQYWSCPKWHKYPHRKQ